MFSILESNVFVLTRSTRTAGVRRPTVVQIFYDTFHTCCFDSGRCGCVCRHCVFKSFPAFHGVSLSRHWQSCAVNFAGWASRSVTTLFECHFADVDIAGSSVVTVTGFGRSGFNIRQLWGGKINIGSRKRLGSAPKAFHAHSAAICGHIPALL